MSLCGTEKMYRGCGDRIRGNVKMKRTIFRGLGMLLCFLMVCLSWRTARADVIWTPNDDFFLKHYSECERVERSYLANGQVGYITIQKDPLSAEIVERKENGTEFYISFSYIDKKGKEWGVVEFDQKTGWIPMEELTVVYDNISFCDEHEDELQDYQGEFDDYVPEKEPLVFYEYPGSGSPEGWMEVQQEKPEFSRTYEDSEGRLWGYVGYYFAHRGWICLCDPTNTEIPAFGDGQEVTIIPPAKELPVESPDGKISPEAILLILLVAAVVFVTGLIIHIFWKKKK